MSVVMNLFQLSPTKSKAVPVKILRNHLEVTMSHEAKVEPSIQQFLHLLFFGLDSVGGKTVIK